MFGKRLLARRLRRAPLWALGVLLGLCVQPSRADAQAAVAESLFQEARDLLERGKATEACPKFAESQRLEPATGTLLGLAMCHEQEGKLASAWAEYVEVAGAAQRDGHAERATFADQKAAALRPRLSTLTIEVAPEVAEITGLEIKRDSVALGPGGWNLATPINGGNHQIDVSAPGREPWTQSIEIAPEQATAVVRLPILVLLPPEPEPEVAAPQAQVDDSSGRAPLEPTDGLFSPQQWVALGTAAAGAVSLGVGGVFLMQALADNSDSSADCQGNVCGPDGTRLRKDAVSHGNVATVFGVAGAVLVGAGVTIYLLDDSDDHADEAAQTRGPRLFVAPTADGVWASATTTF